VRAPLTLAAFSAATGCAGEARPAVDPAALIDRAWSLNLAAAAVLEPAGAEDLLADLLGPVLLGVTDADARGLALLTATPAGGGQDLCVPTLALDAAWTENPAFTAGPLDADLPLGAVTLPAESLTLSGAFAGGGAIEAGAIAGAFDLRAVTDAAAACGLLDALGAPCLPCADGERACAAVALGAISGAAVEGLRLESVGPTGCAPGDGGG